MKKIKVYTRDPEPRYYVSALAESVHFALVGDDGTTEPLYHNFGVLYAKAEITDKNTIAERHLCSPRIFRRGGKYIIASEYVDKSGSQPYPDKAYVWETTDFSDFHDAGLIPLSELGIPGDATDAAYVEDHIADAARLFLPTFKGTDTPAFPLIEGFADPVVFPYRDNYYFIATNDSTGDVGLYACCAPTVDGLFSPDNRPVCILPPSEERELLSTFWAPEFHIIGGEVYILFAVGGRHFSPQSHMMHLKPGGNILDPDSWEPPVRVLLPDGEPLTKTGITLDMTHFAIGGRSYLVWSERYHIGSPEDSGSMLYIAETDVSRPWQLKTAPVLLSRPLYAWENQGRTINNEGPYPLTVGGRLFLAYSGGAAGGYSYSVGYLILDTDSDPLDVANWYKLPYPVLASQLVSGVDGPGHISFFRTFEDEIMMAYHGQRPGQDGRRASAVSPVRLDTTGFPRLVPLI